MHRSRISCRPMFGTTQRGRCDHDGAFQIGSTQESGWSVVSYDLGYIGLEAKALLRRRSRVDRCTAVPTVVELTSIRRFGLRSLGALAKNPLAPVRRALLQFNALLFAATPEPKHPE